MAPGVAKTFIKELHKVMDIKYPECSRGESLKTSSGHLTNLGIKKELQSFRKSNRLILSSLQYVSNLIKEKYCKTLDYNEISSLIDKAIALTEDATHQAMEAVIHNLNSMHCLPYSEKLWVYDTKENTFTAMEIGRLTEIFEPNRFKAVSLNKDTGKAEFKFVTAAKRMDNNRKLVEITSNQGASVRVTDNHKVMTLNGLEVTEEYPANLGRVISPRGIKTPCVNNDICLTGYGKVRVDSPYLEEHIVVTEEFAELMGYYMADGCLLGNTSTLCMTTCGKVPFDEMRSLVKEVFGKEFNESVTYYENSVRGTEEKDIRFEIGTRLARMIADKFGRIGKEKKIPIEIMFATDNIKSSFIRAYFRCDGRKNKKYSEVSTVNKLIQEQLAFIILSLGGSPHFTTRKCSNGFDSDKERLDMHFLTLSGEDSLRVGIKHTDNTAFSIPKYDLTMVPNLVHRASNNSRYSELEELVYSQGKAEYEHILNMYINPITEKNELNSKDEYVYDISIEDNENFMTAEGIYVHNSRAGAQVPFSSLNFGTDTSPEGRMVMKHLLLATDEGLGNGETPIFPINIFKLKSGINFNEGDPNYDLFKLACRVSAKRLFPEQHWGLCQ